jgi:hypothetical protein
MKLFRKPNVQNISEWLETATRKIAPPAQQRLRLEIEAHYAESVATHLLAGLSEEKANGAALAELGDVRQAARRFKRQHLTVRQATNLDAWDKHSKSLFQLGCCYLVFFSFGIVRARTSSIVAAWIPLQFLFMVVFPTIAFCFSRRKEGYPDGWLSVLARACNSRALSYLSIFSIGTPPSVDLPNAGLHMAKFENWETAALRLFFFIQLYFALRLARKLHHLQNSSQNPVSS